MKFELSELALEDIDSIWEYTLLNWSISQAENYYKEIFNTIELICTNPKIGISLNEVKSSHRKRLVGSHMIVYKVQNEIVFVDRVLHQRMDIDSQLNG
jgi:toxin ParE1/3/4